MGEITKDEIVGRTTVKPRTVPFGYQVEQWERRSEAFEQARATVPDLDAATFYAGWDAAFREIYGG